MVVTKATIECAEQFAFKLFYRKAITFCLKKGLKITLLSLHDKQLNDKVNLILKSSILTKILYLFGSNSFCGPIRS